MVIMYMFVRFNFYLHCVFFSEDEIADIKHSLCFFETVTKNLKRSDEDFVGFVIQLVLFVFSQKSFSKDSLDEVEKKLSVLMEKTCYKMLYTKTVGERNQLKAEMQVCS